jgi:hypothetical protein
VVEALNIAETLVPADGLIANVGLGDCGCPRMIAAIEHTRNVLVRDTRNTQEFELMQEQAGVENTYETLRNKDTRYLRKDTIVRGQWNGARGNVSWNSGRCQSNHNDSSRGSSESWV